MINILLTFIAYLLVAFFTPIGILWTFIFKTSKVKNYFWNFAISLDQLGNVTCQYILNFLLIKNSEYKFGDADQTISYVIGINNKFNKLTKVGKFFAWLLNLIEKDHVEKAVENEAENIKYRYTFVSK